MCQCCFEDCSNVPVLDMRTCLVRLFTAVVLNLQMHDSASKQDKVQVWEEQRPVSKYAMGLYQEPTTGRTIPSDPSQWACADTGVKENLWLNLSTGSIGSGRQASMQLQGLLSALAPATPCNCCKPRSLSCFKASSDMHCWAHFCTML